MNGSQGKWLYALIPLGVVFISRCAKFEVLIFVYLGLLWHFHCVYILFPFIFVRDSCNYSRLVFLFSRFLCLPLIASPLCFPRCPPFILNFSQPAALSLRLFWKYFACINLSVTNFKAICRSLYWYLRFQSLHADMDCNMVGICFDGHWFHVLRICRTCFYSAVAMAFNKACLG